MYIFNNPVIKCCPCIPKRFTVMLFLMFGFSITYMFRQTLILVMANYVGSDEEPASVSKNYSHALGKDVVHTYQYKWPSAGIGHSLASYYYGFSANLLLSGLLVDRFGGKIFVTLGLLMDSAINILTPLSFDFGYIGVMISNFFFGIFHALYTVAINVMLSRWIPLHERGIWMSVVFVGINAGSVISSLMSPHLFNAFNDRFSYVFFIYGAVGLFWALMFALFCANDPDHDPFLSNKEREILEHNMNLQREMQVKKVFLSYPWKQILSSVPVWVSSIANFGFCWYLMGIINQLPFFLRAVFHLDLVLIGYILTVMFLANSLFAILFSFLVDYIERNKKLTTSANRKLFYGLAVLLPALALFSPLLGCQTVLVTVLLTFSIVISCFYYPSLKLNHVDFSPRYAGIVTGFCHSLSSTGGIFSNTIYGYIVPHNYMYEWQINFIVMAAVYVTTAIPFFIWGSGEIQPWNYYTVDSEKEES